MSNPYLDIAGLELFFDARAVLELADDDRSTNLSDAKVEAILDNALDTAANDVDNQLRTAYSLPLTDPTNIKTIQRIVAAFTKVILYNRKLPVPVEIDTLEDRTQAEMDKITDIKGDKQVSAGFNAQTLPQLTVFDQDTGTTGTSAGLEGSFSDQDLLNI